MTTKYALRKTMSRFIKAGCKECKNEQIVFGKSASVITCLVCGADMATPTGGKTKFRGKILEVLEN